MDGDLQLFRQGAGVTSLPERLTSGKDIRRKVCLVIVYLSFVAPAQTYVGLGESALRGCTKAGMQVPSSSDCSPSPMFPRHLVTVPGTAIMSLVIAEASHSTEA